MGEVGVGSTRLEAVITKALAEQRNQEDQFRHWEPSEFYDEARAVRDALLAEGRELWEDRSTGADEAHR